MMQGHEGYWLKRKTVLSERYTINRVLGEGGMGIVYLGYDKVLDAQVSIKEYFPRQYAMRIQDSADIQVYQGTSEEYFQKGLERFIHEAKTLAKFDSIDSIVMVKDFFYENGTAYIVMEYVQGENLKSLVEREGRMDPKKVLAMMQPILNALEILHQEGMLHRDISPDNIILRENGKAVLIDFGAARFSENQENRTMTVFFKRGYSAEEQYIQHSNKGAYTDVYGACATMYFMLTGIHPEESIRRLLRDNVVSLTKFHDIALPESVKSAIMKGMSLNASKRYETMGLLCKDLYSPSRYYKTKKYVLRGLLILTFVIGIAAGFQIWNRPISSMDLPPKKENSVVSVSGQALEMKGEEEPVQTPAATPTIVPTEKVPDVKGLKLSEAKNLLKNNLSEVSIEKKYVNSEKISKGKIIHQSVKAGKKIQQGEKIHITLTISKGKQAIQAVKTPTPTTGPVTKKKEKTKKTDDFAGVLPW